MIPLIVSEIQAVLEDERVSDLANRRRINQWLNHQLELGLTFTLPQQTTDREFRQGLASLLEYGVGDQALEKLFADHGKFAAGVLKSKKKAADVVRDQLTRMMTLNSDCDRVKDRELAVLMSVRSRYASPAPRLALGSIVLETQGGNSQYLLCVQPRCDSVRLVSERPFPFLPMKEVAENENCDFIIEEKSNTIRLRLNDKPFGARMVSFAPLKPTDNQILSHRLKSGRFFKASGTTRKYRWVADVKPEHAQRVANEYAYQLSRVGLTESEWLRRWMPGNRE